ncbi:MAG TPA: V-type ATP synthase subunit D [Gemmatimonadaceae bacterium]|nr:V-type ATP synthase subunit D [Gemmatimonadaceae bacterium]
MSGNRLPPTRANLLRARRELERVRQGAALIRRKREALVAELFRAARPAMDLRERIARSAIVASEALLEALAVHGEHGLRVIAWPERAIEVELRAARVWGIPVAEVVARPVLARGLDARGTAPAMTGPTAATTASRYEELADLLIEAAPREQLVRRLGDAVSRASRQLRTLEQRVTPALAREVSRVRRELEERDREERLRLRHVQRRRNPAT